jgi:hypothetical protein
MAATSVFPSSSPPPRAHHRWGGCAEELLHYTSRYYAYTEAFLRNLVRRRDFHMAGYQAERLSGLQRSLMLAILISPPERASGIDAMALVERVLDGEHGADPMHLARYRARLGMIAHSGGVARSPGPHPLVLPNHLPPLDPFQAIAERLELPVRVAGRYVEVPFEVLVRYLDSPTPQVRDNLQQAILWLHDAGYHLCNHPHLTHAECR